MNMPLTNVMKVKSARGWPYNLVRLPSAETELRIESEATFPPAAFPKSAAPGWSPYLTGSIREHLAKP